MVLIYKSSTDAEIKLKVILIEELIMFIEKTTLFDKFETL